MYQFLNEGYHPCVINFVNNQKQFPMIDTFPVRFISQKTKDPFALRVADRYGADTFTLDEGFGKIFATGASSIDFYNALVQGHKSELRASSETIRVIQDAIEDEIVRTAVMNNLTDVGNYYKIRQDGQDVPTVEYIPSSKYARILSSWPETIRMNRNLTSVIRFALKRTNIKISDADLENMANKMKAYFMDSSLEIVEIRGPEIKEAYSHDSNCYDVNLGDLANSCMRHANCQEFFGLYTDNPDVVSMLVARYRGKGIVGRALVWKLVDGTKCVDRIYGSGATQKLISAKGIELGYRNRDYLQSRHGIVDVQNYTFEKYPFLDTLYYSDEEQKRFYSAEAIDRAPIMRNRKTRYHRVANGGWSYV